MASEYLNIFTFYHNYVLHAKSILTQLRGTSITAGQNSVLQENGNRYSMRDAITKLRRIVVRDVCEFTKCILDAQR